MKRLLTFAGLAAGFGLATTPASAGVVTGSASPNALIADGNDSGLVSTINIPAATGVIQDVNVTLTLVGEKDGGWNGDLYIYLSHGGVLSVLANRPGVSGPNLFGYGDNGLANVTFDDNAANGDFHVYQETLGLTDSDMPITGSFQPDGRRTDPANVQVSDPRTGLLSIFNSDDPTGDWFLFVADLSQGGAVRLASWSLSITTEDTIIVPEAHFGLFSLTAAALALGLRQRHIARARK